MSLFNFLFSFQGRIGRQSFWLASACLIVVFLAAGGILHALAGEDGKSEYDGVVGLFVLLPCFWIALAIQVKRWHDRGHYGSRVLVNLIPIVGLVWVIVELGCLKGTAGANPFGPDPLQASARSS